MLSRLSLLAAALAVGRASAQGLDYCFAEDGPADGLPGCPPAGSAAATKYHELRRAAAAPAEAAEAEPAEPGRQLGGRGTILCPTRRRRRRSLRSRAAS